MIHVDTEIEPPGLDLPDESDEPDEPMIHVSACLIEADDTYRRSSVWGLDPDTSDELLADALISCLRGVAASRSPGLAAAVERRLR